MDENVRPYYKDYIANVKDVGYKSLHITLYDNMSRFYTEVQLRTKAMDDFAEIGIANHKAYEAIRKKRGQGEDRLCLEGQCIYFDEVYERVENNPRTWTFQR